MAITVTHSGANITFHIDGKEVNVWYYDKYIQCRYIDNESVHSYCIDFIVDHAKEFIQDNKFNTYDGSVYSIISCIVSMLIMVSTGIYCPIPQILPVDDEYNKWIKSIMTIMLNE